MASKNHDHEKDPLISGNFRSVLPHEPLRTTATGNRCKGYVHLQGAFEPKLKFNKKRHINNEKESREKGKQDNQGEDTVNATPKYYWTDNEELESALMDVLNNELYRRSELPHPVERVHIVVVPTSTTNSTSKSSSNDNNEDQHSQQQKQRPFNKARLQFASVKQAIDFQTVWRKYKFSPFDLFGARQQHHHHQETKDQLFKDFTISFGSHPCLATVITAQPLVFPSSLQTKQQSQQTLSSDHDSPTSSNDDRWTRSNPPKFRRLLHDHNDAIQRSETRFVYISGLFDSNSWNEYCCNQLQQHGHDVTDENDSNKSSFLENICHDNPYRMMDAIRRILGSDDVEVFLPQPQHPNNDKKSKKNTKEEELLFPPSSPPPPYLFCHVGMKNAQEAQRIVRDFQGVSVTWELDKSNGGNEDINNHETNESCRHQNIRSGQLFLDYVTISNKSKEKLKAGHGPGDKKNNADWYERSEPSRPECTSTTDHVTVPGLVLVDDFVSVEQEEALMAVLTGPQAPWAPYQLNKSQTGAVKRKVQHYGYVFDYQTADVLRDRHQVYGEEVSDERSGNINPNDRRANCPPLPVLPIVEDDHGTGPDAAQYIDERINDAVRQGEGWEVLAGVIEKTRRHEFHLQDTKSSTVTTMVFDKINQLTVNQYKPGEGIGSHTDTISAFGDGLISICLNSGIVMEFRNPKADPPIKKLVYLPQRSLLLMSGPARFEWEHQIVTRRTDTHEGEVFPRGLRISLTLRTALQLDGTPMPRVTSSTFPPSFVTRDDKNGDEGRNTFSNALVTPDVEKNHVHRLYDAIATQWHHTRGKRGVLWPGATQFLQNLQPGSIVADVGCGDGKYFPAIWEAGSYVIGTDISRPLLETALLSSDENANVPESRQVSERRKSLQDYPAVAVADCMSVPLRSNSVDAAICIAVMHHLSTLDRRRRCIEELVRIVKSGGQINIQAWAMEQTKDSRRRFASTDVFVPFNAQPKYLEKVKVASSEGTENAASPVAEGTVTDDVHDDISQQQVGKSVAEVYSEKYSNAEFDDKKGLVVFQRYCHMYRTGEIEKIVEMVDGVKLIDSGYELGNHFVILEVL